MLHPGAIPTLKQWLLDEADPVLCLRARCRLRNLNTCDVAWHLEALKDVKLEHEAAWALRLMTDHAFLPRSFLPWSKS